MSKKILHLITGLEIGGTEMMLLKTLPKMQDNFDNRICCIRGRGPMGKRLENAGIPVYYLDLKNIFDLEAILRFKKIIREFEPKILVTYLIHADIFGRFFGKLFGIKKIICSVRVKLIQAKYLPLLFLNALTSPLVTHYHFNSRTAANMYRKFFFLPRKKITIIPNGIEIEKYNIQIDKLKKKKDLGLPEDKIIIGCVAKLRKQKGHKYLIEAFGKISKQEDNLILLLIGDGEERKNIEKQIEKLNIRDRVYLLGNRNDIPEILQIIDVFVLPTLFEGMSNALMEAMVAGKPIITTDIPENRELINDNVSGILIPTKDPLSIAKNILKLTANKLQAQNIAANTKKEMMEHFSLEKTTREMISFFDQI
jgi:glycosyltransferase involved in cell wall biosynthesis